MATQQPKTPGVYINEPNSFPPSIVAVATAVPAFIGYTEKALQATASVNMVPVRISSLADYVATFGGAYNDLYYLADPTAHPAATDTNIGTVSLDGTTQYSLMEEGSARFYLYDSLRLFFANGGGDCFIVSCGLYQSTPAGGGAAIVNPIAADSLVDGLNAIANVVGPTMLVVPDAALLHQQADNANVIAAMLDQCAKRQDRVALLDLWGADSSTWDPNAADEPVTTFRTAIGGKTDTLAYGIAYFPFILTSVVDASDISINNFDLTGQNKTTLVNALTAAVDALYPAGDPRPENIKKLYIEKIGSSKPVVGSGDPPGTLSDVQLMNALVANIPAMGNLLTQIANARNTLPPSPAMAGIYATVDATRGVWNAPANISINDLVKPVVDIIHDQQEDLNAPPNGLAVNAIRTFPGRGTLVWGARTLLGNSQDWRYIQVRRTMIFIEQSIKVALDSFVFGPNDASTWVTVTSMIESFLHGVWSAGGLMGATPQQAYNVQAGLGSTMTSDDVLKGIMRVQVVLTMIHPAEFIELTFEQQMLGGS